MLAERINILLVEDDPSDAALLERALSSAIAPAIRVVRVERLAHGRELLAGGGIDLVLLDLSLPDAIGTETVARAQAMAPEIPIVVLTGLDDEETALEAMKRGAQDYLVKGQVNRHVLVRAIRYAIERKRAEEDARRLLLERAARAEAEAAASRLQLLVEVSRALASSFDYAATLSAAAMLVVPHFADYCLIDVLEGPREIRRVAAAHADPALGPVLEGLRRFPPDASRPENLVLQAMRTGTAVVIDKISDAQLQGARSADHLALMQRTGVKRGILLPLMARGRTLGCISLYWSTSPPRLSPEDIALAGELAGRAALALDNARLYRAREEVVAIVSHDLRNPLNVIGLCAANLEREALTTPDRLRIVATARRSVARMNGLIGDLLDMTRIEGGRLVLARESHPPLALIGDADETFRALADEKEISLERAVADGLPAVFADRERTLQVFSNLIGNAVKFTPRGGRVTLGAARNEGGMIRFSVTDTGPGIRVEDRRRVFERFWQGDAESYKGAGLGLSIAKGIVDAHGGTIWVQSGSEQGSSFCFTLPIEGAAPSRGGIT